MTRYTLTHIKGTMLEALLWGRWEKSLIRDRDGRMFMDVNPTCFQAVVDYLNELRIAPPESALINTHLWKEDNIIL